MRLWTVLALLATFVASVQAQAALLAIAKEMPTCSLICFKKALVASTCATDLTAECMCTNVELNAQVTLCASQSCTIPELLTTKNVSLTSCGAEVRDRGETFSIIGITGIAVAVIAFILRMLASIGKGGRQISWDDATMGLVVLLAIPPAAFAPMLVDSGIGKDMWTLKPQQITDLLKYYFFGEIFYVVALGVSKISILFFYLRVFPAKDFRLIIFIVMGFAVAYTLAFGFATALQCWPVSFAWTQWDGFHEGHCNNIHLQGWIAAAINIALDIVVMVLPLKHLANLNMDLKKKLMVMAMFSVGIFVTFTSAIRLASLVRFSNSENISWDYFEAGYWSLIEVDVSILCGCMPAHRFVVAKAWPKIKETLGSTKKSTNASSKFTGGTDTSASHKTGANISVKPKQGDEGDFVPLVEVETKSARADPESRPDSWTMGKGPTGKEHV